MATGFDVSRLEALLESAKLLQSSLDLDVILKHLLRTAMGRLVARKGLVAVRRDGELRIELVRGAAHLAAASPFDKEAAAAAGIDRQFPIRVEGNHPVGLLALGGLLRDPAAGELEFLEALLGLAASVISNAQAHESAQDANRSLAQRIQELRALLDLGRGLAATLDPDEVARLLTLTLAGRWAVTRYAVGAWKDGQPGVVRQKGLELGISQVTPELATRTEPYLIEAGPSPEGWPPGTLVIPIRSGERTIGVVVCGPRLGGMSYQAADREFGAGLAAQAAVALENAWHFRDTLARQQLEKELALAASIQKDLFPKKLPELAGYDVAAKNRQARQVGGDYYDVLPFAGSAPADPHLLCVADISGKGISAALLMSTIQATLRALLRRERSLLEIAGAANELLYATTPPNKYATAFLCAVDPGTPGEWRFVNCGHNPAALLRASGEMEMLDGPGLALGLFPRRTCQELRFRMEPGDILALYSDGVSEAQDAQDAEYGTDRMCQVLRQHRDEPACGMVERLLASIDAFASGAAQFDDITVMIVKRVA